MKRLLLAALAAAAIVYPARAVVNAVYAPVVYTCNGTTTDYAITFPYLSSAHLTVSVTTAGVTTNLVLGTQFSVAQPFAPISSTLTLYAASTCPNNSTLKIGRNVPNTQTTNLRAQGPLDLPAIERALDSLEMQIQQIGVGGGGTVSLTGLNTWTALQTFAPTGTNANAIIAIGRGTGLGLSATGGGTDGDGVIGLGGATNGRGVVGLGAGFGNGGAFIGGSGGGNGVRGDGQGGGAGVQGFGDTSGPGVAGTGGSTSQGGVLTAGGGGSPLRGALRLVPQVAPSSPSDGDVWVETGTNTLKARINGTAQTVYPQGAGISLSTPNTWTALQTFSTATTNGNSVVATGNGTGYGVVGTGGTTNGSGVRGVGGVTNGIGLDGLGVGTGAGVSGAGGATGAGVIGLGGGTSGVGGTFTGGPNSHGVLGTGAGSGAGLRGIGGASGHGVEAVGSATSGAVNMTPQAAPSTPSNGDLWVETTSNTLKARINGVTQTVYPQAAGGSVGVHVDATTAAAQSIPTGGTDITVVYGTVVTDSDSAYNSGTGTFTVPTGKSGPYIISAAVEYQSTVDTTWISIYKNGTIVRRVRGLNEAAPNIVAILQLADADAITIRTRQSSTGSISLTATAAVNWISIKKLN